MKSLRNVKIIYSIFAVCLTILGLMLLVVPNISADIFFRICSIVLILFGIVKIVGYFSKDILQLAFQYDFAVGIASGILGIIMMLGPEKLMEGMTTLVGLLVLIDALLRIQTAMDAKKIGVHCWWVILIISLAVVVISILLFLKPYSGAKAVILLLALNLIIYGILNILVVQSTVNTIQRNRELDECPF